MNSKVSFILGTIIGAGIGVAGTYSYFKDKYEKLAEKDFNSRRVFDEDKKDESEEPVAEKTADSRTVDKPSIAEYAARLQKEGYVNYSNMQDKNRSRKLVLTNHMLYSRQISESLTITKKSVSHIQLTGCY